MTRQYFLPMSSLTPDDLPILKANFDQLENWIAGNIDDSNVTAASLTAASIAAATITGTQIAAVTVAPSNIVATPQTTSGSFTGDGTANRVVVALTWTPRFALITRQSDGQEFTAMGDGTNPLTAYWRTPTGVIGSGTTDWVGIIASTGLKTGTNAAPASNQNGVLYYFAAWR